MTIKLVFGFNYDNLHERNSLVQLDNVFLEYLKQQDELLYQYLIENRELYQEYSEEYGKKDNELILIAKYVEEFLLQLFPIMVNYQQLQNRVSQENKVFLFRKLFVNKYVKNVDYENLKSLDFKEVEASFYKLVGVNTVNEASFNQEFNEDKIVNLVLQWLENKDNYAQELKLATNFMAFLFYDNDIKVKYGNSKLFFKAKKYNFEELISVKNIDNSCIKKSVFNDGTIDNSACNTYQSKILSDDEILSRDDFSFYKDSKLQQAMHNSNYCVKCHARGKDNCRLGEKKNEAFVKNPLQVELQGCPLGMHISQMHSLNESNNLIAALVAITINNPLCAGTGNNICYDCVNSCIFQKQERVNTPLVETHILKEVLDLPWGFEIYNLLTLWNPLRVYRPYPKELSDYNILVVGSGPAGYSLAYNLLQEGHGVVVIDALKIEPLKIDATQAIIDINNIIENLDERVIAGFGGVSEYGITTRWNKNYLTILRLILERNSNFYLQGSIKFGTSLTINNIKELGFHHVALCVGAGNPNLLKLNDLSNSSIVNKKDFNLKDILNIKGIKTSSEFLMVLHQGAFRKDYIQAMQIQLPFVVLGAGLTAVDVATEAMVYYRRQVEKFVEAYEELLQVYGYDEVVNNFTEQDKLVLNEYLQFYELIQQSKQDKSINLTKEIIKRGGIKIVYHKQLVDSKAYKNNHEELESAMKQGIEFVENMQLHQIVVDDDNNLKALEFKHENETIIMDAKTLVLALGTNPNKIFMQDMAKFFNQEDNKLHPMLKYSFDYKDKTTSLHFKQLDNGIFMSILGDLHNVFSGSVVKAIASSLHGYSSINNSLEDSLQNKVIKKQKFQELLEKFQDYFKVKLVTKKVINNDNSKAIVELTFKGKAIYNNFKAGMFYKLQNYEQNSENISNKVNKIINFKNVMEPLFLSAIKDEGEGCIKTVILKAGGSSAMAHNIVNNIDEENFDNFVLMGPLGSATKIGDSTNILLIGGGVANVATMAVLLEAKARGNKIVYIAGYKNINDVLYLNLLKEYADNIFLCIEEDFNINNHNVNIIKDNNKINYIKGNVIDGIKAYAKITSTEEKVEIKNNIAFKLNEVQESFIAGSAKMMAVVKEFLISMNINNNAYASINATMQCGIGGVCGACLQVKEVGGEKVYFYACRQQDQNINFLNFNNLIDKLQQNSLQEKLISKCLAIKQL